MSQPTDVSYTVLATAPNQASKVLLCETPYGTCVLKRWLKDRVAIGGNRSQPLAEYGALLDLQDLPNINAPLRITLDKDGVDFIYVHCGQNALQWRAELVHEDDDNKEQTAERLAQHVAVHVLRALEEVHKRGLVHRDVKPTNILIRPNHPHGGTWLSDMGLTTRSQELSGFVKGLDLQYIPPEYITCSTEQQQWHTIDDLQMLAAVTTPAADMYQLGLTLYELITGSLPSTLLPPKRSNRKRFNDFLQRVATFNWPRAIKCQISNPKIASVLLALLSSSPTARPLPSQALAEFQWLQEGLSIAGQQPWSSNLGQQAAWALEQQQALRAAGYVEYLRLQEEFAALAATAGDPGARGGGYGTPAAARVVSAGTSRGSWGSTPGSTPFSTPGSTPYTSPAPVEPTVSAEDSFGGLPSAAVAGGPGAWGRSAAAAAHRHGWALAAGTTKTTAGTAAAAARLSTADPKWGTAAAPSAMASARSQVPGAAGSSSWESTPYTSPVSVVPTVCAEDSFASFSSMRNDGGSHSSLDNQGGMFAEGHDCSSKEWSATVKIRDQGAASAEGRGVSALGGEDQPQQPQQHDGW